MRAANRNQIKHKTSRRGGKTIGSREREYMQEDTQRGIPRPLQVRNNVITHSTTLRFASTASAPTIPNNITWKQILDTLLVATTTTIAYQLFEAVKLREVRIWTPTLGKTDPATPLANKCSVEFIGGVVGQYGDQEVYADLSVGLQPGYVRARPSKRSLASNWQEGSSNLAIQLLAPPGSVIDLDVTFRSTSGSSTQANSLGVSLSPGGIYYRGLDGQAQASTTYYPAYGNVA